MAEQLTFELAAMPAATFENFVAGPNREAVRTLERIGQQLSAETGVILWGASGAGKTHLLQATVERAQAHGRAALFVGADCRFEVPDEPRALVAVDRIDLADAAAQAKMFSVYNALAARNGQLIASAAVPPGRMAIRDDLRTRLGWGLVFEIVPLSDADKPSALSAFAHARGFDLSAEVIAWLLAHGRRDMGSLVATLVALDRHSLALQRPITVPLLRDWMQRQIFPSDAAAPTSKR